ncbi:MAG: PAS domain S-box protein [Thermoplasmata archaeon]
MMNLKQELSYLMLGQQGGENRIKILEHIRERSYNINQLSNELGLNYRTIKHHIDILLEHDLIVSSGEGYGEVYFISPKLEKNYDVLKEIERKLHTVSRSPELYEKIREQTRDGLIILDEDKDVIFLNKRAMEITGYKENEILGKNITEMLKSEIYNDLEQAVLTDDEIVKKDIDLETKNGDHKSFIISMDYFHFDDEHYKGFSLLLTDITIERKQNDILEALMKHSDVMMAYLDSNFCLLYVNSAYAEQTDHDPMELIGMNHFDIFPNGENKRLFEQVIKEKKKRTVKDRNLLVSEDSDQKGLYWSLEPVIDGEGNVKGLVLSSYKTT